MDSYEIDSATELPLYFGRIGPMRFGGNSKPSTDRALSAWVTRPEFLESPTGCHLHEEEIACHQFGDKVVMIAPRAAPASQDYRPLNRAAPVGRF